MVLAKTRGIRQVACTGIGPLQLRGGFGLAGTAAEADARSLLEARKSSILGQWDNASDSLLTASQVDGVFGSDRRGTEKISPDS
jgi:hypothetical protein